MSTGLREALGTQLRAEGTPTMWARVLESPQLGAPIRGMVRGKLREGDRGRTPAFSTPNSQDMESSVGGLGSFRVSGQARTLEPGLEVDFWPHDL